jgi:tricorn protease-like protein
VNPADVNDDGPFPFTANPDNTGMVQLTSHEGNDVNAIYSPDGNTIVWVSDRTGSYQIWTMNADGTNKQQITQGPKIHGWPQWSPDSSKLVYWGYDEAAEMHTITTCNADGSNEKDLVGPQPGRLDRPTFRPNDGAYIAYAAQDGPNLGDWDIWVISADGSQTYKLTDNDVMNTNPLWRPDGMVISYKAAPSGDYTMTLQEFVLLENGFENPVIRGWDGIQGAQAVEWSPDGSSISYTAETLKNASGEDRVSYAAIVDDVHMTGPNTSGTPKDMSKGMTLGDRGPRFSPDGSKVVFWAWDQAYNATLWLNNADGSGIRRLTESGPDMFPTWHPSGASILFESFRSGNSDIWTIPVE